MFDQFHVVTSIYYNYSWIDLGGVLDFFLTCSHLGEKTFTCLYVAPSGFPMCNGNWWNGTYAIGGAYVQIKCTKDWCKSHVEVKGC